jgi:hypothetical protein
VLTLESPSMEFYQQTNQDPCIIGGSSCNSTNSALAFPFTLIGSGPPGSTYDTSSPVYTVQDLIDVLAGYTSFWVGIDINTAGGQDPEILQSFSLWIGGVQEFVYTGPSVLGAINNGTGWSDSRLLGFDLSGFDPNATAQFFAHITNASNGAENLFLVADRQPVPEPVALLMLGLGMFPLARRLRRR